jgi:hypothetical protein
MADAATISAAEARNGQKPLSNFPGDTALQILSRVSDNSILKASLRQKIVDMPAPGFSNALLDLQVSLYPLQAPWTPGRAGVGVVAPGKEDPAQATYGDIHLRIEAQHQGVNSGLHVRAIERRLFEIGAHGEIIRDQY